MLFGVFQVGTVLASILKRLNTQAAMKKALIVEDHPDILEILIQVLETLGFTVVSANTGMEGVTKAVEEKPQLILMDIMMQGMADERQHAESAPSKRPRISLSW